jgi:hypothetical protein
MNEVFFSKKNSRLKNHVLSHRKKEVVHRWVYAGLKVEKENEGEKIALKKIGILNFLIHSRPGVSYNSFFKLAH